MPHKDTIARLAALYEAATPRDWVACIDWEKRPAHLDTDDVAHCNGGPICRMVGDTEFSYHDARLIAHAHNLMPKILDVLRAGRDVAYTRENLVEAMAKTKNGSEWPDIHIAHSEALHKLRNALDALQEGGP